ncbi:MAG: hypothetical protein IRY99_09925, partial [Isosphaeraceae bacterium]|nr:hypothetical protein [Isosphaeraceae bacterium]
MGMSCMAAWTWRIALGGLFALAIWLRITSLDGIPELNSDEAWYGIQAARLAMGQKADWFTSSGNLADPFYLALEAPLHWVAKPSVWVLRFPAAASGVLAVALTFWLGRRALGRETASIAAILMASAPMAIILCRVGCEFSQTPLIGVIVLALAFRACGLGLLLALLAGLAVHPTNIFLVPIALPVFLVNLYRKHTDDPVRRRRLIAATLAVVGLLGLVFVVATLRRPTVQDYFSKYYRALDWAGFLVSFARYFFVNVRWFPVPAMIDRLEVGLFWGAFLVGLAVGGVHLVATRQWDRIALVAGLIISVAAFHGIGGSDVLSIPNYRYGAVLVVPTLWTLACLIQATLPDVRPGGLMRAPRLRLAAVAVAGWAMLGAAKIQWFDWFTTNCRESLWTLKTEERDPYQRAWTLIQRDVARNGPRGAATTIIGENWWYWRPVEYLAVCRKNFRVVTFAEVWLPPPDNPTGGWTYMNEPNQRKLIERMRAGAFAVAMPSGFVEQTLKSAFPPEQLRRWDIPYRL